MLVCCQVFTILLKFACALHVFSRVVDLCLCFVLVFDVLLRVSSVLNGFNVLIACACVLHEL